MQKVTAVITCCGQTPQTIERALLSVLDQSCPAAEVLLIDDNPEGSPLSAELR